MKGTSQRIYLCLSVVLSLLGATAWGYGPAGCGLGSLIIEKDTIVSQTLAETTNATLLTQFFGITSGTSNCNTNGFVMREKEAEAFAEANIQNLEVDMARGQGESLTAFAQILGCNQNAIPSFGHMTQTRYEALFPASSVDVPTFLHSVENEMINNTEVRQGCLSQTS